jgi:hypothetical protein
MAVTYKRAYRSKFYDEIDFNTFEIPKNKDDRVAFAAESSYSIGESNPVLGSQFECLGAVTNVSRSSVQVLWDNGKSNTYNHDDLALVRGKNVNPNILFKRSKVSIKKTGA